MKYLNAYLRLSVCIGACLLSSTNIALFVNTLGYMVGINETQCSPIVVGVWLAIFSALLPITIGLSLLSIEPLSRALSKLQKDEDD